MDYETVTILLWVAAYVLVGWILYPKALFWLPMLIVGVLLELRDKLKKNDPPTA